MNMSTRKCQRCGDIAKFVKAELQWKCTRCGLRFRWDEDGDFSFRFKSKVYNIPKGVRLVFPKWCAKDFWDDDTKNAGYWKSKLKGKRD